MNSPGATLLWFRQDLRLSDNPALQAAVRRGRPIYPVFIWSPEEEGIWSPGGASRAWLSHSLRNLQAGLKAKGCRLVYRTGPTLSALQEIISEAGAGAVYWNRRYEPLAAKLEINVQKALVASGIEANSYNSALLFEPWEIQTRKGGPFQVFTPFWKTLLRHPAVPTPLPLPRNLVAGSKKLLSQDLKTLEQLHQRPWARRIMEYWEPGEEGAKRSFKKFITQRLKDYPTKRNFPADRTTSNLSPHLHFGEIGPRTLWHQIIAQTKANPTKWRREKGREFLRQLAWREFAYHCLHHFPHTPTRSLRKNLEGFSWARSSTNLRTWRKGCTGFPLVDAGMRELWVTGGMHNRIRMVVASFLIKDLMIPWQQGARWFWDTLVDADLANNTLGWQWVAGCGADAAPFFRIFNPTTQAQKFDPEGKYIREWVPELRNLPPPWIFQPWRTPPEKLQEAGIRLGKDYPKPLLDHAAARSRLLSQFKRLKRSRN